MAKQAFCVCVCVCICFILFFLPVFYSKIQFPIPVTLLSPLTGYQKSVYRE